MQRLAVAAGITEGHLAELDQLRAPLRRACGARARRFAGGGDVQVTEQVGDEQPVLVEAADGGERRLDGGLPLAEGDQVQGQVAERDARLRRPIGHEQVRGVESEQGERAQHQARGALAQREPPVLRIELVEQRAVAPEHQGREPEDLHFLHVRVAREDPLQVVLPPALRSAPRVQPEGLAREARLGEERRERGGDDHQRAPPGQPGQERRVGGEDEELLAERGELQHQGQRPDARLPARVLHLVVRVRVLEVAQLEGGRLLQDERVDVVPQRGAHQVAQQRLSAREHRGDDHQAELDEHVLDDAPLVRARAGARRLHHRVDDELPYPRHRRRDHRLADEQRDDAGCEAARRVLHQLEDAGERAQVAQGEPDALAQRLWGRQHRPQCSSISCTFILSSR